MDDRARSIELERIQKQINIFNEIGKTLTSSLTITEVLEKILSQVASFFSPENWSLLLIDEEKNELYFEIAVGEVAEKIKDIRLKVGEGVAGWVAKTGRPLLVPSVKEEPLFTNKVDELSQFTTESVICIPLKIRNKVLGVLELVNKKDITPLHRYDLDVLATVADYAAIAIENAKNYEQVQKLTITDDLTGLYNARHLHRLLQDEMERYERDGTPFSIIFFDLDSFKQVNDTNGHLLGSRLLTEVGEFLMKNMQANHAGARYGGDEFVIILSNTSKQESLEYCTDLHAKLREKKFFPDEGLNIRLTASFGIAAFPEDAKTKDMILHVADERMYKVKGENKDGISAS